VRIADEIVDTYRGNDARELLDELEADTYRSIGSGYSANPVVHAYALTARTFEIEKPVIEAFFASMRMDITGYENIPENYEKYVYGSAEAVGLMCLSAFVEGDKTKYVELSDGARALGAAYQKINFLRDLASDKSELNRWYFPGSTYQTFDDEDKRLIVQDIQQDISAARVALEKLPRSSRRAVNLSLAYYDLLLRRLESANVDELKQRRLRVPDARKIALYVKAKLS
jgi:phytoene/squalene synthetase